MTNLDNIAGPNKGAAVCQTPMACSIPKMVTYLIRGALVHHGLSDEDSRRVSVYNNDDETKSCIAVIRVLDRHGGERELIRVEDEAHLNRIVNSTTKCGFLVSDINTILENKAG